MDIVAPTILELISFNLNTDKYWHWHKWLTRKIRAPYAANFVILWARRSDSYSRKFMAFTDGRSLMVNFAHLESFFTEFMQHWLRYGWKCHQKIWRFECAVNNKISFISELLFATTTTKMSLSIMLYVAITLNCTKHYIYTLTICQLTPIASYCSQLAHIKNAPTDLFS